MTSLHWKKCQAGHGEMLDALYAQVSQRLGTGKSTQTKRPLIKRRLQEPVGTALKNRIQQLLQVKSGKGCGCETLVSEMDRGGLAWCESQREYIVLRLMANRDMLADAVAGAGPAHAVIGWALHTRLAESVLQAGANWLLDRAMEDVRSQAKPVKTRQPQQRRRKAPQQQTIRRKQAQQGRPSLTEKAARRLVTLQKLRVDFVRDGVVATTEQARHRTTTCVACPLNKNGVCDAPHGGGGFNIALKVQARAAACPLGKWFAQHDCCRPLVNPVRNMIFHIYPKIGAEFNWHWHIENIKRVSHLFNGRIAIGVVTGNELAKPEEVQRLLEGANVTDWIIRKNDKKLGETVTFQELLKCVNTNDPNAVTFRGHCKGVTYLPIKLEQQWARFMWATCMDLSSVDDALASHLMAGSIKCHESVVSKQKYDWFYAGTFYWFRNREIFQRDWQAMEQTRWYPEAWPGVLVANKDAVCLCHDFADRWAIREDHWKTFIMPSFEAWKLARPNRMVELE